MFLFNSRQIKQWDEFTIANEPVSSIDLMERAAFACKLWLEKKYAGKPALLVCCGTGNNGGDGLALARLLAKDNWPVSVYIAGKKKGSDDFETNLMRLQQLPVGIHRMENKNQFPSPADHPVVIDALFGSGLNRAPAGMMAELIQHLNSLPLDVISIDIPSGLFMERTSLQNEIIRAKYTLTFQATKLAFLLPENSACCGNVEVVNIGLSNQFLQVSTSSFHTIDTALMQSIYRPRTAFAHKGSFGHALVIAGSYGKIGAAVLAARACLHSGVGLLTVHVPKCGYEILQTTVPEAMVSVDYNSSFSTKLEEDFTRYKAVGIGPGLGTASETQGLLHLLLQNYPPALVIDADGLNLLAKQKDKLPVIPVNSILTPHPKEFERLFGKTENDWERIELALRKAKDLQLIIVLKGHHTFIALPDGTGYFNTTGNAGMATGGSGDVLTGLLTGLLAQGYEPAEAAIFGVYLHGLAGDLAAATLSMEAMSAGALIDHFGAAFLQVAAM